MSATVTFTMVWSLEEVPDEKLVELELDLRDTLRNADGGERALFALLDRKGAEFLDCSLSVT
jgi:hypothetical protein